MDIQTSIRSRLSHEFRTPLNAIIGFSEILASGAAGELSARQAEYVGSILASGRKMLRLIDDLLEVEGAGPRPIELRPAPFETARAIEDVLGVSRDVARSRGVALETEIAPGAEQLVADPERFRQILHNLVSNAIKYCPDEYGGVTITVMRADPPDIEPLGPSAQPVERYVRIAVSDNGIGIDPADHQRIFDEFEQVDESYSRSYQGIGLGLALSRKLTELHGGRIWVESELGKGSTFFVVLPALPDMRQAGSDKSGPPQWPA